MGKFFQLLGRAGSGVIKWFGKSSAKTAVKGAKSVSAWKKVGRVIWKGLDIGLTGYAVYEIFVDDTEGQLTNQVAQEFMFDTILCPEIKVALAAEINDVDAISFAFANKGLALIGDEPDGVTIKGLAYITCSSYLHDHPVRPKYGPDAIKRVIAKEMNSFLQVTGQSPDFELTEDVRQALEDMDLDEMPDMGLRNLDFLAYFLENFEEALGIEESVAEAPENSPTNQAVAAGSAAGFTSVQDGDSFKIK